MILSGTQIEMLTCLYITHLLEHGWMGNGCWCVVFRGVSVVTVYYVKRTKTYWYIWLLTECVCVCGFKVFLWRSSSFFFYCVSVDSCFWITRIINRNYIQEAAAGHPLSSIAGLAALFHLYSFLSFLPPPACLFGYCCSLLAHAGPSYCSILAAGRETETERQWEREECRTVSEGIRDDRRILMTVRASKHWQLLHIHHSAFVTVDSWT